MCCYQPNKTSTKMHDLLLLYMQAVVPLSSLHIALTWPDMYSLAYKKPICVSFLTNASSGGMLKSWSNEHRWSYVTSV